MSGLVKCELCDRVRGLHNWNCPNKPLDKSTAVISVAGTVINKYAPIVDATEEVLAEKRCTFCKRFPRQGHSFLCRMKTEGVTLGGQTVAISGNQTTVTGPLSPEGLQAIRDQLAKKAKPKLADELDKKVVTKINFPFVLIDLTTDATSVALRPGPHLQTLIDAWFEQIQGPYANHYGAETVSFRIGKNELDRKSNEIAIHFRDTIPEAPDALAYHQVVNGVPDIEIGVDLFTELLHGTDSLASGGSHEILETLGDAGGNGWKDRQDSSGIMDAEELCDFVQNTGYKAKNGVTVSNFVLPSFFIPGSAGPWDFLGVMKAQYDYSHGYGIVGSPPSDVTQVMGYKRHHVSVHGTLTELQIKRKTHPYTRTSRRGVKASSFTK